MPVAPQPSSRVDTKISAPYVAPVVMPQTPSPSPNQTKRRSYGFLILGVVLIVLFVPLYLVLSSDDGFLWKQLLGPYEKSWESFVVSVSRYIPQADGVTVGNYTVGRPFIVKQAVLSKPGYVVVTYGEASSANGYALVGNSEWLPSGKIYNVPVTLSTEIQGRVGALNPGSKLFVGIYRDDGDSVFDPTVDVPVVGIWGIPVGKTVTILQ